VPAGSVKELIAYAKAQPNGIEYGTAGAGSLGHLATELFAKEAGIKLTHVPYKGQAPSTMGVLNGEVKMLLTTSSDTQDAAVKAGKLKLLGVSTAKPSPLMPGAPTIGEQLNGYEVNVWFGILAPKGTPAPVIDRLHREFLAALRAPAARSFMESAAIEPVGSTPAEFGAFFREEKARWAKIIKETGARID
jgi:tripartite-type tricarboxylate transporter receptor subunit TctC